MYRILIVDDEAFITDSLAFMLENQRELELEAVKAYSAIEALNALNRAAFHIVVSDIEMPGQSGLDLLCEINTKWPSCRVVFLTGHDNFQYAQQAMRYNAVRYVLKNEGDEILLEAVTECIRRIENEQKAAPTLYDSSIMRRITSRRGREALRQLIVHGQDFHDIAHIWQQGKICLDPQKDVLLMAALTKNPIDDDTLDQIQAVALSKIGHAVLCEAACIDNRLSVWLMQPTDISNHSHALAAVKGLAEGIQEAVRYLYGVTITFILEDRELPFAKIPERLLAIKEIAGDRLNRHEGIALIDARFFDEAHDKADIATGTAFVGRVLTYIREHIGGDLSLTAISELVYLNPSYLSRRFKEITGKNLTDTILEYRMNEACRRLLETNDRAKNIAAGLGYASAAHFSRVFKREKGMTPQEYRELKG